MIRCREITTGDLTAVADLLTCGFPEQSHPSWVRVLEILSERTSPARYPRYGYLLEIDRKPVGVLITIFSTAITDDDPETIRCCVSSWFVKPEFRSYATMLTSRALARPAVTYLNITPKQDTFRILEAQGYKRYCNGVFLAIPAVKLLSRAKVIMFDDRRHHGLKEFEAQLLSDHAKMGCFSVVCSTKDGSYPFVFTIIRTMRVPVAYLTYCRNIGDFTRFAGSLGRFLAVRGHPFVGLDANGAVPGLLGQYFDNSPKYYIGQNAPRIGDLAYTERPLFKV
jgi:hypothetical protein